MLTKKIRKCKNCYHSLKPTTVIKNNYRVWECLNCGNSYLWWNNPCINNSWACLHRDSKGGFDVRSMMNDPDIHYNKKEIQFIINKEGVKTHRYHRIKKKWIKINQENLKKIEKIENNPLLLGNPRIY